MILIWKPRCLNTWQMSPFIGQNSEILICWLIVEWVATSWLWQSLSSSLPKNIIDNVIIWTDLNHESSRKLSHISRIKTLRSFGLLELEIWAEHWTVSGLQDRLRLLRCCYNLDLKTAFLNLGLLIKVLGLCLSFPSI